MKAHLMFQEKVFEIKGKKNSQQEDIMNDLEIEFIISEMSQKDKIINETCQEVFLNPLLHKDEIIYRQNNLTDAISNKKIIRELYEITLETEKKRSDSWAWLSSKHLLSIYSSSVELLQIYVEMLHKLRLVTDKSIGSFKSRGFTNLFKLLQKELSDDYFDTARKQLEDLSRTDGTLISSKFGDSLQGTGYTLRERDKKSFSMKWVFAQSYSLAPRDERGAKDIEHRRMRAKNGPANVLAQAAENLEYFFSMLRRELAFFVGCINLFETIEKNNMTICMPSILVEESFDREWKELFDLGLLLTKTRNIIGNESITNDKNLFIITGANQGGKTSFLRSIGQAQIMAQCGMFVCANEYKVPIRNGIFTHFKREEDDTLTSGKLDEEMRRLSKIVDQLKDNSLILFNESFASTNEREGSEINNQITRALVESHVEVFSVTHLNTYATSFLDEKNVCFLRAQRLSDGRRTFKIQRGIPLTTAFGKDLYDQIF